MKANTHWIILASLLAAGAASAQAPDAEKQAPRPFTPSKELLAKYDANGDGKLDESELAKMRLDRANEFIAKHDKDGDAKLNVEELTAALENPRPSTAAGENGQVPEQARAMRAEMLKKYDANGDGKLDETELAKMRADRAADRPNADAPKPEAVAEIQKKMEERRAEMLKKYDANGDGKLDETERAKMRADRAAELIKKFDKDGDGKLNADEVVAAGIAMGARMFPGGQMPGQFRRGGGRPGGAPAAGGDTPAPAPAPAPAPTE